MCIHVLKRMLYEKKNTTMCAFMCSSMFFFNVHCVHSCAHTYAFVKKTYGVCIYVLTRMFFLKKTRQCVHSCDLQGWTTVQRHGKVH